MEKIKKIENIIRCPDCQGSFIYSKVDVKCSQCRAVFEAKGNRVELFKVSDYQTENEDSLVFRVKSFFKKFPRFYEVLLYTVGPPEISQSPKKFIKKYSQDKIILNIGSGSKTLRSDVINVDIYPYSDVNLTADAEKLPIKDNSVDVVICESLLEHLDQPQRLIDETHRVLKEGGRIFFVVPFILGFHSSPNDFRRWTHQGLGKIFGDFQDVKVSAFYGPTAALTFLFGEWLAILFSFNIKKLYNFWILVSMALQLLLTPLQWLDYLLGRYSYARNISYGFSIIATKK